jgi:hypothetical protein
MRGEYSVGNPGHVIKITLTGLIACDKFKRDAWYELFHTPLNATNFPEEPWMCRNRTLARGFEDLANNLTISMLSSANFMANATTLITVSQTQNIYKYDWRNLFLSYGALIVVTVSVVSVGIVSSVKNGVYHHGSFSAILATTRNPDFDVIYRGVCLGIKQGQCGKQINVWDIGAEQLSRVTSE